MKIKDQKKLIHDTNWDYLIILDACRYDFFERFYKKYLDGELAKVETRATHTGEWLARTFTKFYSDVTYISANPTINSKGISVNTSHLPLNSSQLDWNPNWTATEHFSKIIDVWDFGWSEKYNTVPPKAVTETVIQPKNGKKKIIHYNQPHEPYLSLYETLPDSENTTENEKNNNMKVNQISGLLKEKLKYFLGPKLGLRSHLRKKFFWKLKNLMRVPADGDMERAWREKSVAYFYEDNLLRVLTEVQRLLNEIDGKIIVTSDHGECLGEKGFWGHGWTGKTKIPKLSALVTVPWVKIEVD